MDKFEEISHFILTKATNDELRSIVEFVQMRRKQLTKATIRSVIKGDQVVFNSQKMGSVTGTVLEVKVKNLIVDTPHGRFRVPASMATFVARGSA